MYSAREVLNTGMHTQTWFFCEWLVAKREVEIC
jgi:hypothetical protein